MQTNSVPTSLGATTVWRMGSGPPVLVFHGGPGFGHAYLVEHLRFLAAHRELIFYDQPGCGAVPAAESGATLHATLRHALDVLEAVADARSVGVVAHSWGALVLVGALADGSSPRISEGLLINPTAVNRQDYETARRNFSRRVPHLTKLKILFGALAQADGASVMKQLMPYYAFEGSAKQLPDVPLNTVTYRSVDASLGAFDFTSALDRLKRTTIVRGEADFTTPSEIEALIAAVSRVETITEAGHFPFFEKPDAFRQAALRAFKVKPE